MRGFTRTDRDQSGVTLIEALIVLAVTGLIIAGLAGVLINGLNSSARSHERLIENGAAQQIAEAWTQDVVSVDPEGADHAPVDAACFDPSAVSPGAPGELELVSFGWDLDAGAGHLPKTATWVLVEDGDSTSLVRRYCEDGFVSQHEMATDLGPLVISTAHGPVTGSPEVFCPADENGVARTCTLVIPALDLELTVTRRVPDYDANTLPTAAPPPPAIYAHDARYQYVNVRFRPSVGQPATAYEIRLRKGSPSAPVMLTRTVNVTGAVPDHYQVTFGSAAGDPPLDVQALGGPPVNYYVTAVATNAEGSGIESDAYGPMNPQPTGPDKPATPTATRLANGCVRVAWTPNAIDGGSPRTGFRVWAYEAPTGSEPFVDGATTLIDMDPVPADSASPPVTSYDFCGGLSSLMRYRFVVADKNGVDVGLKSDPSGAVMVFTPGTRFVATTGSDAGNDCLTPGSPCRQPQRAVDVSAPGDPVAVAKGAYDRFVINGQSVVMVGGFGDGFAEITPLTEATAEADTTRIAAGAQLGPTPPTVAADRTAISVWTTNGPTTIANLAVHQSDVSAGTSTSGVEVHSSGAAVTLDAVRILGGNSSEEPTGLLVSGSSQVNVTGSWIDSGAPDTGAAGSGAYGVRALDGASVAIEASHVTAAPGVDGRAGSAGAAGGDGCGDHDGGNSSGDNSPGGGGVACGGGARGGGAGGKGAKDSGDSGSWGSLGGQGSGAGAGGNGNSSCGGDADGGGGGGRGVGGPAGSNGTAGSSSAGVLWTGASGSGGTAGGAGTGGSGGGGGGSGRNNSFLWWGCDENRPGGGGGAGGQGGVGGSGGAGGTAGGGSFGIYVYDATVVVGSGTTVTAGDGGDGGAGGRGGEGGDGGHGGDGGSGREDEGGAGGGGGGGGGGGAGGSGAGGQGGLSVAVFFTRSAGNTAPEPAVDGSVTLSAGSAGSGGVGGDARSGGSGGTRGSRGVTDDNDDGDPASHGVAGTDGSGGSAAPSGADGSACRILDLTEAAGSQCTA